MTFFKQISLVVSLLFILLASIIMFNNMSRTSEFLQGQMRTSAQDMATTLGIVISNSPQGKDQAALEVLFSSIFDSGYYTSVALVALDGTVIHQKSQQIKIDGVPDWFLNMVQLPPAQGSTQVMQGWTQLGQLNLSLHPGYAYRSLYEALLSTVMWSILSLVFIVILLWTMLHYLLSPLPRIKEQADAIHKNKFIQLEEIPSTIELRAVVEAMNRMVFKVKNVFDDQERTLFRYQQLLYHDKLTGAGNRHYLLDHLQQALTQESAFHGSLVVVKLINLELVREQHGYQQSDDLIVLLAHSLTGMQGLLKAEHSARLSDDEFAFLLAADEESALEFTIALLQSLKKLPLFASLQQELYPVAGLSILDKNQSIGDLLADVDYCLSQAASEGPFAIKQTELSGFDLPKGKMQWRAWLESTLNTERLYLVGQMVLNTEKNAVQRELYVRTSNEKGQVIPASAFMPMASGLGMAIEIDKAVFKLIGDHSSSRVDTPLAVNLSAAFFEEAIAQEEFVLLLALCQQREIKLCVEANHHVLLQHPVMCAQVSEKVKKYGHQFGMDQLDMGQSLQLLQSNQLDYVKINANTICEMSSAELSSGYQALKALTDSLDIQIIAVGVDSLSLYDRLIDQGVEMMQGNFLGAPERLEKQAK